MMAFFEWLFVALLMGVFIIVGLIKGDK